MVIRRTILVVLLTVAGANVQGQSGSRTHINSPQVDQNFYFGKNIDHPEALSGVWEAPDGDGGAVGIHVQMMTTVPLHANPPIWTPQSSVRLDLSVFHRRNSEFISGAENYLSGLPNGSQLTFENGHLRAHFVSDRAGLPSIDLDLLRQTGDCWHGRLHREGFDSLVTLCRPTARVGDTPSSLVGTWVSNFSVLGCVHIFANDEGGFTGWSDVLQVPGRIIFNPKGSGPKTLLQLYGSLLNIRLRKNGIVSFDSVDESYQNLHFVGLLFNDVSKVVGSHETWTKVSGDSCVTSATLTESLAGRN